MTSGRDGRPERPDEAGPRPRDPGEDLLPERTRDEDDASWDWREGIRDDDERYLRERPPHHEG